MTQTFQREKIDGEKKKLKLKIYFWSKGKQQKILFFLYHSIFFFRFFECLVFLTWALTKNVG